MPKEQVKARKSQSTSDPASPDPVSTSYVKAGTQGSSKRPSKKPLVYGQSGSVDIPGQKGNKFGAYWD
ncbi:hypothetical protein LTR53_015007 [Teratosphaeriaceae sp. CCFEE 6253]|nr:hypothetical protein LTR53_016576 [Teratosphaeriaceae sp. CCFEE 6253]KAK3110567.1 hypothetical protein LTR53_015007 [Teratosphaeriaceae sp. CCFEE 6253]